MWALGSLTCSFTFFTLNEVLGRYFEATDIYHNFFTDYSLSAFAIYKVLHPYLRGHELLQTYTTLQIKDKAQKYCLILCLFGLGYELYI